MPDIETLRFSASPTLDHVSTPSKLLIGAIEKLAVRYTVSDEHVLVTDSVAGSRGLDDYVQVTVPTPMSELDDSIHLRRIQPQDPAADWSIFFAPARGGKQRLHHRVVFTDVHDATGLQVTTTHVVTPRNGHAWSYLEVNTQRLLSTEGREEAVSYMQSLLAGLRNPQIKAAQAARAHRVHATAESIVDSLFMQPGRRNLYQELPNATNAEKLALVGRLATL